MKFKFNYFLYNYYYKIFVKNFIKKINYNLLALSSLIIGFSCLMLLTIYIIDELSYDRYNKNHNNIYRIIEFWDVNDFVERSASCPFPLAPTFQSEYPDFVKNAVRIFNNWGNTYLIEHEDKKFNENKFVFVDSSIFSVFSFEFLEGDSKKALNNPNKLVITESIAKKYFGKSKGIIGKILTLNDKTPLEISGVVKDLPSSSHFHFNFFCTMLSVPISKTMQNSDWSYNPCWTYILIEENTSATEIKRKLHKLKEKYIPEKHRKEITFDIQLLTDIHLKSELDYEIEHNSKMSILYILFSLSFIILIISLLNYSNIFSTTINSRNKEFSINKVLGSNKMNIHFQLFFESTIYILLSLLIALIISGFLLHFYNALLNRAFSLNEIFNVPLIIYVLLGGIIISGLTSFLPTINKTSNYFLVQEKNITNKFINKNLFLIFQYIFTIISMILSLFVTNQSKFLINKDIGFNRDNILIINLQNTGLNENFDAFKEELILYPRIVNVTATEFLPGIEYQKLTFHAENLGLKNNKIGAAFSRIDYDFIDVFGFKLLEGRACSKEFPSDRNGVVIINESFQEMLNKENVINTIKLKNYFADGTLIGVVKDFNYAPLNTSLGPFAFIFPRKNNIVNNYIAIKILPDDQHSTLQFIRNIWVKHSTAPLNYNFLNDRLKIVYHNEKRLSKVFQIFSVICVLISLLGIYGIILFATNEKIKDITIRKVLGSPKLNIIRLFLKDFITSIIIASIISIFISYYLINSWLENYIYKIRLDVIYFIIPVAIIFITTLIVVSFNVLKTFNKNLITNLVSE